VRLAQKFEIGLQRIAKARRVRKELEEFLKDVDDAVSNTYKNLAIGMVQGQFEQIISRHSIFLYLRFERFLGDEYGWDEASYWSTAIFQLTYAYLVKQQEEGEDGLLPMVEFSSQESEFWWSWLKTITKLGKRAVDNGEITQDELWDYFVRAREKVASKKEHSFDFFFYGHPQTFGAPDRKINNYGCGLSRWLYGGDGTFRTMFGVGLMKSTKSAITRVIYDVEHGQDNWEALDNELAGSIYLQVKDEMNEVDKKLIAAGEDPKFRLPEYGV
jgi:hypothetical protein